MVDIGLTDLPRPDWTIVPPPCRSPTSLPCTLYNLSKTIDTFLCFLQSQLGTHVYRLSLPRVLYVTTPGPSEPGIQGAYERPSLSKHLELLLGHPVFKRSHSVSERFYISIFPSFLACLLPSDPKPQFHYLHILNNCVILKI